MNTVPVSDLLGDPPQIPVIPSGGIQRPIPHGQQPHTPPTIYIIRHGEKNTAKKSNGPDDNSLIGLNVPGQTRANTLPFIFNDQNTNPYDIRFILAMQPQPDGEQERPFQTILPLFQSLLQTKNNYCLLDNTVLEDEVTQAAQRIKDFIVSGSPGNILVCWEHHNLQYILEAFGFKGAPVYPELFDVVWELNPTPYNDSTDDDDDDDKNSDKPKWSWNTIAWSTEGTMADVPLIDVKEDWIAAANAPDGLITYSENSGPVFAWSPRPKQAKSKDHKPSHK